MKKLLGRYLLYLLVILLSGAAFTAVYFGTGKQFETALLPAATDLFAADNGWEMSQPFTAEEGLCGAALLLCPPDGDGTLTVTLFSPDEKELVSRVFAASDFSDSGDTAVCRVTFSNIFGGRAGTYSLRLVSAGYGAPGIAFSIGGEETSRLDGNATDYSLSLAPVYSNRIGTGMFFTLLLGVMLLIAAIYLLVNTLDLQRETAFPVCISAFLLIGMLILPLGAGADESRDLPAVWAVSGGQLAPADTDAGEGVLLPGGFEPLLAEGSDYDATLAALENDPGGELFRPLDGMNTSFPAVYFPAAAGAALSRLFTDNAGIIFYAARLSSALFALLLLCLTMRLLPYGRRVFFVVCLNPAVLTLFCSVSAAALPVLLSFLLFALTLHLRHLERPLAAFDFASLFVLSSLVALSGAFCVPLCLLPLLIGRARAGRRPRWLLLVLLGTVLPAIGGLLRAVLASLYDPGALRGLGRLFSSPLAAVGGLLAALRQQLTPLTLSLFGERLGEGASVVCGGLTSLTLLLLTLFCALLDRNLKDKFGRPHRRLLLSVCVLSCLTSLVAACLLRDGGADLSARALFPLLLPALFLIGDNRIRYDSEENSLRLRNCVFFFGLFPFAFSMLSVLIAYL